MNYGNKGYVAVAIFGLIMFSCIITAMLVTQPKDAMPAASAQRYENMLSQGGETGNYAAYPTPGDQACYASANHDSADLCAQWRAALASERAADASEGGMWIALVGAILSGVSIFFVVQALHLTRQSNKQAKEEFQAARKDAEQAAKFAAEANEISRTSMLDQGRPWVFAEPAEHNFKDWRNGDDSFCWKFRIVNHGEGLAIIDHVEADVCFSDTVPVARDLPEPGQINGFEIAYIRRDLNLRVFHEGTKILRPDEFLEFEDCGGPSMRMDNIPPDDFAIRQRLRMHLHSASPRWLSFWLLGKVRYRDGRNRQLETGFCYRLTFGGGLKIAEEGGEQRNYRT